MTSVRSGKLDRRVELYSRTVAPNASSGQPVESFALLATVWAELVPLNVTEPFKSEAPHAVRNVVWRIRWLSGLQETYQVRYGGKIYKITGIQDIGRQQLLELTTEVYE
jgi:SPP1 family predicted phage head-tail adaptor